MNNQKLGEHICELRKKINLTQKELAELVYVSDKTISKWETGKSVPDLSTLAILAKALEVSLIDLLEIPKEEEIDATVTDTILSIYNQTKKKMMYRYSTFFVVAFVLLATALLYFSLMPKKLLSKTQPVENPIITCGYNCYQGHKAVDFGSEALWGGEPIEVYSVVNGVVMDTGYSFIHGHWVLIESESKYYLYSMLDNTGDLYPGDVVAEGEYLFMKNPISSGRSTGPHIEIMVFELKTIDPKTVIPFEK
jgi:Predicted transcriptional regulators